MNEVNMSSVSDLSKAQDKSSLEILKLVASGDIDAYYYVSKGYRSIGSVPRFKKVQGKFQADTRNRLRVFNTEVSVSDFARVRPESIACALSRKLTTITGSEFLKDNV